MTNMNGGISGGDVRVGFVALLDAAPIIAAHERGLFAKHGVRTRLSRELGWANVRDKLDHGELEAAHCPAPVLPMHALNAVGPENRLITAVSLGAMSNVITLSRDLWEQGVRDLAGLAALSKSRPERPLRFGYVLHASSHHLLLRYWLAAGGVDTDSGVRFTVVPPTLLPQMIATGHLDGYCVGEPWNHAACRPGDGWAAASTGDVHPGHAEKVLAVREVWAERNPAVHAALIRGIVEAALWCDEPANRTELARMLASRRYLGTDADLLRDSLDGRLGSPYAPRQFSDLALFFRNHGTFPFRSQILWVLTQMVRWRMAPAALDYLAMARTLYRPDLYRDAIADMNVALPRTDMRTERCFDGRTLDPLRPAHFLQ